MRSFSSAATSSNSTIFCEPTRVSRRSLRGSSHERWTCAICAARRSAGSRTPRPRCPAAGSAAPRAATVDRQLAEQVVDHREVVRRRSSTARSRRGAAGRGSRARRRGSSSSPSSPERDQLAQPRQRRVVEHQVADHAATRPARAAAATTRLGVVDRRAPAASRRARACRRRGRGSASWRGSPPAWRGPRRRTAGSASTSIDVSGARARGASAWRAGSASRVEVADPAQLAARLGARSARTW